MFSRKLVMHQLGAFLCVVAMGVMAPASAAVDGAAPARSIDALAPALRVGDVVFIRVGAKPFREVAAATGSWTNHVGIVVGTQGAETLIGESTFPFSRTTTLARFVARSQDGRVAVMRLAAGLSAQQQAQVSVAADARSGIFYDTGFNLHSRGQFCSRYVREVLQQASGVSVGQVETFETLLKHRPETNLGFWNAWYFGRIPWQRETVTPASLLNSAALRMVYDGRAVRAGSGSQSQSKSHS